MATQDTYKRKEVVTGSAIYEGETKNGMKHGVGTLSWDDGDQYIGEFENDEKVRGTFNWKGGDQYAGDWKHSLMHGRGIYTYRNGRRYEGEWVGGYKEGKGIFTWPNGDKYDGEFHRDQCHGEGTQEYADGRVYRGQWAHNKKQGYGVMIWKNKEKSQGYWHDNLVNGVAIYTESNGKRYLERWKNGVRETLPANARIELKRSEEEMKQYLKATESPAWAPDHDFKLCLQCDSPFGVVNRRHHCRHCGGVFCNTCTSKRISVPRLRIDEPCRVCDECFILIQTAPYD
eukprot:TRINITY_DN798_c1_g2_i1.p1 TRINITY_DN798_c1_g2~~TRINITY_DN798_c1_g2_i1.p1  ORF type:complete len:287 (-),score=138.21 TRINITY_DN798_c1_g2_i1:100-960(-)